MSNGHLNVTLPPSLSEDEAKLILAVTLYKEGKATLGQAAKMAGFSKRAFIEVLGSRGVPVVDYSVEELRQETKP